MFYSESFRVFPFTVQSLIHIELIFKYRVYGENQNSFLSTKYPAFPVPFVEAVFPQWIVLTILSKIDWPDRWGSSLSSLFYSMVVDVCPTVVPSCFNYCIFWVKLPGQEVCVLQFGLFLSILLFLYRSPCNYTWIGGWSFLCLGKEIGVFVKIALKLGIILYIVKISNIFSFLCMNRGYLSIYLGLLEFLSSMSCSFQHTIPLLS